MALEERNLVNDETSEPSGVRCWWWKRKGARMIPQSRMCVNLSATCAECACSLTFVPSSLRVKPKNHGILWMPVRCHAALKSDGDKGSHTKALRH